MKYLTESQADEMDFGITINKMAKFMVENPQYGLFDFMYGITENPDNNLTSYGANIYTVKNSG